MPVGQASGWSGIRRLVLRAGCYNLPLSTRTNSLVERAGRWFLDSGIQETNGGVARYYRSDLRANAGVSTEITGYAVSTLLYLHAQTNRPEFLESALRAARFLVNTAWDARLGTFPFEHANNGSKPRALAYFFD